MPTLLTSLSSSLETALAGGAAVADIVYTAQQALATNLATAEAAKSWPTLTAFSSGDLTTLYGLLSDGGGGTDQRTAFANAMAALKAAKAGTGTQQTFALAMWQLFKAAANSWPDLVASGGGF